MLWLQGDAGRLVDAGDHPNPAVRQLQAQLAAARAQRNQGARPRQPQAAGEGNDEQEVGGAVGGVAPPNPEGQPGQPLDIQRPLEQLVDLLVQFLGGRGVNQGAEDSPLSSDQENSSDEELDWYKVIIRIVCSCNNYINYTGISWTKFTIQVNYKSKHWQWLL